ncbi:MAG: hypothetical protein GF411_20660 [Candidatus Lokiarchaeota archaeon]|nr:hypothetical protein [Candidatus Lokiarchaeota archaeon]
MSWCASKVSQYEDRKRFMATCFLIHISNINFIYCQSKKTAEVEEEVFPTTLSRYFKHI